MRMCRICIAALAVLFTLAASLAFGQQPARSLDELRLKVKAGDTIYLTDQSGRERRGRLIDLSSAALTVSFDGEARELPESSIRRIRQRQPDPLWMGGTIGAAIGGGLGVALASFSEECSHNSTSSGCVGPVLSMAGLGAAVGIGVDALIQGRKVIYEGSGLSVQVRPLVAPGGVGIRVSVQLPERRR